MQPAQATERGQGRNEFQDNKMRTPNEARMPHSRALVDTVTPSVCRHPPQAGIKVLYIYWTVLFIVVDDPGLNDACSPISAILPLPPYAHHVLHVAGQPRRLMHHQAVPRQSRKWELKQPRHDGADFPQCQCRGVVVLT